MSGLLNTLKNMDRPQLLLSFVAVIGLIAPGTALIWTFSPQFIAEQALTKILWLSFVLTSPIVFICFLILSVISFMLKTPRTTQEFRAEFTFAISPVVIAYFVIAFANYIWEIGQKSSSILGLTLIIITMSLLIKVRLENKNNFKKP